ncbi:syntaxin-7 isoform X2 [Hydra vulgaris]|uniref:Syntaxin-7 isoform X2 n=1 Tax=Hydra vulgaris TaxID=6087 RepID=A0ABM4D6N1_HYDVU
MSRGDFGGGYQDFKSGGYSNVPKDDNNYQRISTSISNNISMLTKKVASIQRMVNQIGTSQDVPELFELLQNDQKEANQMAKQTSTLLKQLSQLETGNAAESKQRKIQQEKFQDNFTFALQNLQKVQRLAAEKERSSVQRARAKSIEKGYGYSDDTSPIKSSGVQLQVQQEAELSLDMIKEREDALRQLESDIVDVNEIFKDLAIMVHEQGEVIDSIEANVATAAIQVETGNAQLEKAKNYQKSARKKKCCLLVILLVAAAVIGLIIYFSVK